MITVNSNERIDDLQRNGYRLIQNPEVFCFGIDAVLLAHFAKVTKKTNNVLDIGTGTGIIPILMHAMYGKGKFTAIDIQEEMVEMANRSVLLNGIEEDVSIKQLDVKDYKAMFEQYTFDLVTCNPPYMKGTTGLKNEHPSKTIARHEVMCTLEDIIEAAAYVLKDKGKFCMIHRPQRLVDIIYGMKVRGIEPKRMRMVHGKAGTAPTMVLVEGVKNGGSEMRVESPLIVYNDDNTYTKEILEIYDCEEKKR
ncbi:MAG: tRNA1(Val) (adenine(37)-N6)-methyltransferase [Cellulosilyticaceae bacterium]